ncbi:MAG: ABC-F family ATP-binding cassette domain-containing protein [Candidatus Carbobacillus altaicus]|nr:ABC-F family ATP-binding cassette domain-containing protein [Candidatus Carbobacillus altaicus]
MIILDEATKTIGGRTLLYRVNFTFEAHGRYVIYGPSGIGKTTLLNLIAGYDTLSGGRIIVQEGAQIQYLFQESLLFSNLSVEENMRIKWLSRKQAEDNGNTFQNRIRAALATFFSHVDGILSQKIYTLSGGERRRVELAQVVLSTPDILLLDEPTANLDPENKIHMIRMIGEAFPKTTHIIVSHDDHSFFEGYRHLKLREGTLVDA